MHYQCSKAELLIEGATTGCPKKMAICEKGKQTEFSQGHLVYSINDKHGHNP